MHQHHKTILFSALFILCNHGVLSQAILSGSVAGEKTKPVPGASIFIKNTLHGCPSDSAGFFTLTANSKAILCSLWQNTACQNLLAAAKVLPCHTWQKQTVCNENGMDINKPYWGKAKNVRYLNECKKTRTNAKKKTV